MHRAHADDLPGGARYRGDHAAPLEFAHSLPRAKELAGEIHGDDLVPLRERHLLEGRVALQSRVVHQDVDGAEVLEGPAEHVRDFGLGGDIRADRQRPAPCAHDLIGHLDRLLLAVPVVDDDVGTGLAKRDGNCLSDARIRAGDERLLSGERLVLSHGPSVVGLPHPSGGPFRRYTGKNTTASRATGPCPASSAALGAESVRAIISGAAFDVEHGNRIYREARSPEPR